MKKRIKKIFTEFKYDLKYNIKELLNKNTFYKQIPNLLTTIRALVLIPFNILYFSGNLKWATIILAIAFFTDAIDGNIARKYNLVSKFGANLDAICDKIMAIGVMIPVCFSNSLLLINLALEIIIATTNTFASLFGIKVNSSKIGKFKTWPLFITITLFYMNLFVKLESVILNTLITITALLQVLTTMDYISKHILNYFKKQEKRSFQK